jgi:AAA+ superfamily predicted ATPase
MSEIITNENGPWEPPIFHSESVFYRTILSERTGLVYVTMERDWLLESICKAVIRLQLDGKLEKLSVNIVCFHNHSDVSIVTPKIGWKYDENEAMQFISTESWGDEIELTKVDKDAEITKQKGAIKVYMSSVTDADTFIEIGKPKQDLLRKAQESTLEKEDLPHILLRVAIRRSVDNLEYADAKVGSLQQLRMYKKPKVERFIDDLVRRRSWEPDISDEEKEEIVNTLAGKSTQIIREVLSLSISHVGKFDLEFIKWSLATTSHIMAEDASKRFQNDDEVEVVIEKTRFKDIAGIDGYVDWINRTTKRFTGEATEFGFIKPPRGALLLGPPGTGKTMMAKATANAWDFGMIRMRATDLNRPGWGNTEETFAKFMKKAKEEAPCILFFDEMEKLFDQKSGGSESTDFLSGFKTMFLEFMQESEEKVFVIATTNALGSLPPEIVERFDGRFFVNLPDVTARENILNIHLVKRKQKVNVKILKKIAADTDGYSGRGLEDLVDEAMSIAFEEGAKGVKKEHLIRSFSGSKPVSITHQNVIQELQKLVEKGLVRDASGKSWDSIPKMFDDVSVG